MMVILAVAVVIFSIYQEIEKRKIIRRITSLSRGEWSEQDLIYRLVKAGVPSSAIFHDLYIPSGNGHTQVDLIATTDAGIFVFEVKDYSGWIFGNGDHTKWTQVLARGQVKHQFYNPIKQNEGHIAALRHTTKQLQDIPIYSVVVFYGNCRLKDINNIPNNCRVIYPESVARYMKYAMQCATPISYQDREEIMQILKSGVENGANAAIRAAHLQKVQRVSYGKYQSTYSYHHFRPLRALRRICRW
jgi:hypothetical protein